jgi:hypothetical protein
MKYYQTKACTGRQIVLGPHDKSGPITQPGGDTELEGCVFCLPVYRGSEVAPDASIVQRVKSISLPHPLHTCFLSNSSEKISFSLPQSGHLQEKDSRFLNLSNPGQCSGVVILGFLFASLM